MCILFLQQILQVGQNGQLITQGGQQFLLQSLSSLPQGQTIQIQNQNGQIQQIQLAQPQQTAQVQQPQPQQQQQQQATQPQPQLQQVRPSFLTLPTKIYIPSQSVFKFNFLPAPCSMNQFSHLTTLLF